VKRGKKTRRIDKSTWPMLPVEIGHNANFKNNRIYRISRNRRLIRKIDFSVGKAINSVCFFYAKTEKYYAPSCISNPRNFQIMVNMTKSHSDHNRRYKESSIRRTEIGMIQIFRLNRIY
jgi:hypothetical protein